MTALVLRVKSLNVRSMQGVYSANSVVRTAAMHNLREFPSFSPAPPAHIDPNKMSYNYRLRGPSRAREVEAYAKELLHEAGVTKYRKDATMALEVLVSLPPQSAVDESVYFGQAVTWADSYFQAPILSAVVHLDEAAPHCHILILPLISGRLNGGRLAGGPAKLRAMYEDFYQSVGRHFGLKRHSQKKRIGRAEQYQRGRFILDLLTSQPGRLLQPPVRTALIDVLGQQSELMFDALGITDFPNFTHDVRTKSFVKIMTRPVKQ